MDHDSIVLSASLASDLGWITFWVRTTISVSIFPTLPSSLFRSTFSLILPTWILANSTYSFHEIISIAGLFHKFFYSLTSLSADICLSCCAPGVFSYLLTFYLYANLKPSNNWILHSCVGRSFVNRYFSSWSHSTKSHSVDQWFLPDVKSAIRCSSATSFFSVYFRLH